MTTASPKLDIGTIYDQKGSHYLRVLRYPNGGLEGIIRQRNIEGHGGSKNRVVAAAEADASGEADSAPRRARTCIRRHIMGSACDRMLTLTYRENFSDRDLADQQVSALLRIIKRWHKGIGYLAVPEYQKRGAIHWHIALNTRVEATRVRKAWNKILEKSGLSGNINLQYFPSAAKQAAYLAKYVSKDMDDPNRGTRKRYKRNRGLVIPETVIRCEGINEGFAKFNEMAGEKWHGDYLENHGVYWMRAY